MHQRWRILATAVAAQASVTSLVYGIPFLLPNLQESEGLSLTQAGLLVSAPILGMLIALIAWGALADRVGERTVMTVGMAGTGVFGLGAAAAPTTATMAATLAAAGLFSAAISAASGRAVLGWFTAKERGLAMGIRQTCTPIGTGLAALSLPPLALAWGPRQALIFPSALCLAVAVLVATTVVDPARPQRSTTAGGSPYRTARLWRIHSASALLVGPQFIAATFALVYLVAEQGWNPVTAGALIAVVQLVGAAGRIGAGIWSDRAGSRMRPMRTIALAAMASTLLWALGDLVAPWLAVTGLIATMIISVTDNGLAFTATAELAGPAWAGKALGVQNTGQNLMALATAPVFAAVITAVGYPWALAAAAALPALAGALTPVRGETLEPIAT